MLEIMETSYKLWSIIDDKSVFKPLEEIYQHQLGKFMLIDQHEDTDDGTFSRVNTYTRLVKRIDNDTSNYLTWLMSSKMKIGLDGSILRRVDKHTAKVSLIFDEPINVVFGYVSDEPIIKEVTQINGEIYIDWFWRKNGRQNKYANGFEVYLDCEKFEFKITK